MDRLRHDIEVTQGLHPLSAAERAVMGEVIERFFSGPAYEGLSHWEGREVGAYFEKVGRKLLERHYGRVAAARAEGGADAASAVTL